MKDRRENLKGYVRIVFGLVALAEGVVVATMARAPSPADWVPSVVGGPVVLILGVARLSRNPEIRRAATAPSRGDRWADIVGGLVIMTAGGVAIAGAPTGPGLVVGVFVLVVGGFVLRRGLRT